MTWQKQDIIGGIRNFATVYGGHVTENIIRKMEKSEQFADLPSGKLTELWRISII